VRQKARGRGWEGEGRGGEGKVGLAQATRQILLAAFFILSLYKSIISITYSSLLPLLGWVEYWYWYWYLYLDYQTSY